MDDAQSSPGDGDAPPITEQAQRLSALAQDIERCRAQYIRLAERWIRRLGVDEVGLAAEGALSKAWLTLQRRMAAGRSESFLEGEDLQERFRRLVIHTIKDEGRRQRAGKRDRSRSVHFSCLEGDGFDAVDPRAVRPDNEVGDADEARHLLDLLAPAGETVQQVALLKMDGFTNREIAKRLDRPIWVVKRLLERIRSILEPHEIERRRSTSAVPARRPR